MAKFEFQDTVKKDLDWLRKYLLGDTTFMPENLKSKWAILNFVDDQLRAFANADEIRKAIEVKYKKKISKATCYRFIQQAKYLFKTINVTEKEYDKRILNETLLSAMKKAYAANDFVAVDRIYRTYWKANDLSNVDDTDAREVVSTYKLIINNNQQYNLLNLTELNDIARNNLITEVRQSMLPPSLEELKNAGKKDNTEPTAGGSDNQPEK